MTLSHPTREDRPSRRVLQLGLDRMGIQWHTARGGGTGAVRGARRFFARCARDGGRRFCGGGICFSEGRTGRGASLGKGTGPQDRRSFVHPDARFGSGGNSAQRLRVHDRIRRGACLSYVPCAVPGGLGYTQRQEFCIYSVSGRGYPFYAGRQTGGDTDKFGFPHFLYQARWVGFHLRQRSERAAHQEFEKGRKWEWTGPDVVEHMGQVLLHLAGHGKNRAGVPHLVP
ncbi:putative membrane protein [Treponema pallidum subsp. pallidum]|nr:putative membrane protein [Treponema pallidum subsp. pallidum]QCP97713.1 putative membrane protein [Treponema pallidum subsp. pallidum]QCQ00627.1 putative membrane protein [Treponema pallidum subsp. pallidum]WGK73898.1 putative membrane protein [Treponema pallidum subsp. pertenue]